MRTWISVFLAVCSLFLGASATCYAQDASAPAPSLAELARQAQKQKVTRPPAKVLTNDDLSSEPEVGPASSSGSVADVQPGSTPPSPSEKLAMLETVLDKLESLDTATLVRNVLKDKDVDFPGRPEWEERLASAKGVYVTRTRDLVQRAKQIVASAAELKGTKDPNDPRVKEITAQLQTLVRDAVKADSEFRAVVMEGQDLAARAVSSR